MTTLVPTEGSVDEPKLNGLTPEAARDLTDQIRTGLEGVYQWIKAAYKGRAWAALGYSSWDDYVTREFGNLHLRPPREDQTQVIASMRDAGMSVRAIARATQLGNATVHREIEKASGVPNGTPESSVPVQGQDGKSYAPTRTKPRVDPVDPLDRPVAEAGVTPLDLSERAGEGREHVARVLREFDGSGAAALPMTIKLAGQVSGLVSPLTGEAPVPDERLHEVAYVTSRGVRTLSNVLVTLSGRLTGEHSEALKSNIRDTVDELDRVLAELEGAK